LRLIKKTKNELMWKIGIIGCGLTGTKRAESIQQVSVANQKLGKCEAVLFCDIDHSKARSLAERYGGEATCRWEDVVKDNRADIVIVSTFNKYSAPITIEALRQGKHVLCEKPLGRTVKEAKEILGAAGTNRVALKTGFNHRHYPAIAKAKALVDRGEIGPLYLIRCRYGHGGRPGYEREWRADGDLCGGGELLDQGVHVVDLFRWFLGEFEEVFGYTPTYFWKMDVEDNAFALFKTSSNQVALMHTSWTQWKNIFSFEVFGEAGYLTIEGRGGSYGPITLKVGRRQILPPQDAADSSLIVSIPSGHQRTYAGGAPEEEIITFANSDISWEAEWVEFISAIEQSREPLGNGNDGLEANKMIEAVYISARENRPVRIRETCGH
jgi:predicted dehydrogenase